MQRTRMIVAAVVAALIAGASVAVAAKLITGKDIKNGSIAQKDLKKKVRDKLNRSGQQGPQGLVGPQGAAGPPGPPGQGAVANYQNPKWAQVDRNTIGSPVAALRAGPYSGPVQPPLGVGSLGLTVQETEKASFGNEVDFIGDDVSALSEVGFRVFTTPENRSAAPPGDPNMPSITFEIDPNGAGGTTTNFSSLTWNAAANSAPNVWSGYIDATSKGRWGLTGNEFNSPPTLANCGQNGPRCSFADVQALLATGTGAKILTAAVGKGRDFAWSGAVDGLRINDIVYDFEPFGTVETAP